MRRLRLMPAAAAISVMIFAVAVAREAEVPAPMQVTSGPPYLGIRVEPEWEPPWYLRYRTVEAIAPSGIGLLPMEVGDATRPNPPRASGLIE
jgi:hypothetical protein